MTATSELPAAGPNTVMITAYWNTGPNSYSARVPEAYLRDALSRWLEPEGGVGQALMVWIGLCDDRPAAERRHLDAILRQKHGHPYDGGEVLTIDELAALLRL